MNNVARTGQTLLIVSSTLFFAALTSAMVVRQGIGSDWTTPPLPGWIWLTLPLGPLASWLVERGRLRWAMGGGAVLVAAQVTLLTTLRFPVIGEAFALVLVGAHAAHAAAGVAALGRFGASAALFWHFAGGLWIYLLLLLGVWA
jgi:hypothetical protein